MSDAGRSIRVRGARTHNLRDVDLDVPLHALVVFVGPSGSGKSSLVFDTIHAESVRRFAGIAGGRDEPESVALPDVRSIEGLGVTIASSSRALVRSSRSSVATLAGVADPIRRIFSLLARPVCARCGGLGERFDVRAAVDSLGTIPDGTRLQVFAPVADGAIGDGRAVLDTLRAAGFVRARIDGVVVDLASPGVLHPKKPHRIEAVVDRFVARATDVDRAREAIELAYRTSGGLAIVEPETGSPRTYSRDPRCVDCGSPVDALDPSAYSRADASCACEVCSGTGLVKESSRQKRNPRAGDDDELTIDDGVCSQCEGLGLRDAALAARAVGLAFRDVFGRSITAVLRSIDRTPDARAAALVESVVRALSFLESVGLGHLALGRRGHTLSTGEASRARLAGPFANRLVDVTYVLDEPTAGLHPGERPAILASIESLVASGNSVLCVEHDATIVRSASHVFELGPRAGDEGGSIVACGPPTSFAPGSFVARLLDRPRVEPASRPDATKSFDLAWDALAPFGRLSLSLPVGRVIGLSGPSGSGKTSLLLAIARALEPTKTESRSRGSRAGEFDRVVRFDDLASFPGPRSLVATRLSIFTALRETFAGLPDARSRGFDASRFGLSGRGGRCDVCEGRGVVRASSARGVDTDVQCPRCGGTRYDVSITAIRYRGASIIDVLASSIAEARLRFEAIPAIERPLSHAIGLGLGHLTLGRAASAVSAGESTRLRLAGELAKRSTDRSLLLLDEPCRGSSADDTIRMSDAFESLVKQGATVLFAEHSIDALARADHLVDLARDADAPSRIAASGRPIDVSRGDSPTARHLTIAFENAAPNTST